MKYSISQQILKKAVYCKHDFSCLETGKYCDRQMCKVDYADGENVLFLETKEPANCEYRVSFGCSQVCTCPVCYAIHTKYGKRKNSKL